MRTAIIGSVEPELPAAGEIPSTNTRNSISVCRSPTPPTIRSTINGSSSLMMTGRGLVSSANSAPASAT
jgi:hypothetical protein